MRERTGGREKKRLMRGNINHCIVAYLDVYLHMCVPRSATGHRNGRIRSTARVHSFSLSSSFSISLSLSRTQFVELHISRFEFFVFANDRYIFSSRWSARARGVST